MKPVRGIDKYATTSVLILESTLNDTHGCIRISLLMDWKSIFT